MVQLAPAAFGKNAAAAKTSTNADFTMLDCERLKCIGFSLVLLITL